MLLYRPKQKISTTASEEVKFPASSIDGLATVATSGSYNDLTDKPEVPGVPDIVQTTGTSTTAVMSQKAVTDELNEKANSADLATVATSGSYNDLSNKPNIPTNYVTTNTEQDVSGKKTFTNYVYVKRANANPHLYFTFDGIKNSEDPTAEKYTVLACLDENGDEMGGFRGRLQTTKRNSYNIFARSFGTDHSNYVGFFAESGATKADEAGKWYFAPNRNNTHDFGQSNLRWNNGYITNLQLCKIINGAGGNSMIQQNGDTSGSDIIVGSTGCPLKITGKNARPVYRQGKGSYNNIALQSDIPIPFNSNDLSTGTYRSTNLPSGHSLIYIEDRERKLSGYFYKPSGAMVFQEIYFITNFYTTLTDADTTLTIYKLKINGVQVEKTYKNLFISSSGKVEVGTEYQEGGTFYYKVLK